MALVKKLTKIGNSWGVILSADLLKVAGLQPGGEYELSVIGDTILIQSPEKKNADDAKVIENFLMVLKKYDKSLKKLADN